MHITRDKNVVVIAIIAACVLATALWPAGAGSHAALPRLKDDSANADGAPILSAPVAADGPSKLRAAEAYGKLPLSFEVNQGQTDAQVKFLSRGAGYNLFLTSTGAVLSLQQRRNAGPAPGRADKGSVQTTNDVLRMKLVGANPTPKIEGSDQLPGKTNYFIGKNPRNWRTNVSTYGRVYYHEIYKGVDLVYYGNQRQLENDFVVAPGADPGVIALAFDGAKKITTDKDGNLLLQTGGGQVRLQKPVIYQLADGVRHEVAGNYVMRNRREVGFEVAAYDLTKPLVIDPVLVYSTYLGGNHADEDWAIAVDASGTAYVTGTTASTDFPGATPPLHGVDDITVVKFNAAGSALIYSTYLGGGSSDFGADIAIDGAGNAYVTGQTSSNDFPTVNAFDSTLSFAGATDAFVTRLNPAGSALVYSTYLSGNFGARGWGIATDGLGNAYVTGTTSTGFPLTTTSAFESTNFNSGFLAKLNTNGSGASSLVYSTFLAHTGSAEGRAIAADATGNVYVTGNTNSTATDFASAGAFQTTFGGGSADAFVEKFNTNLSGAASRVYCTYLGGSGKDIGSTDGNGGPGKAIAIDASGNAYITGSTGSTNFPLANASQGTNGGQNDAFLTKLNATGSGPLIYSTYLGGNGDDFGRSVAVNIAGGAYVTGAAGANFPTLSPLPTPLASVGFVTKFTPSGAVVYSTLLSGVTASTGSFGIAVDGAGNAFATGGTNASIVTTAGAFQTDAGLGGTVGWVTVIADGNPLDNPDARFFVNHHYLDFLNRQPDTSGFNFWTNEITSCGSDQQCIEVKRINVSAAFFLSIEFQQTGYLVERIYKAAYGNGTGMSTFGGAHQLSVPIIRFNEFLPDTQEVGQGVVVNQTGWEQVLENNKQAFTAEFVQRSRFTTAFPTSMTAAQFVDTLNANAGGPLSQSERNQLVSDLSTGAKTRAQVLRAVAEDPDLNNAEFNRAFVLMQYFGYLRRNPNDPQDTDYTGYDFWLTKLNQFNGNFINAEMVKAFIISGEYRQRFGP